MNEALTEAACFICSLRISHGPEKPRWWRVFRAIYAVDSDWSDIRVTGIGLGHENSSQCLLPLDPDRHIDEAVETATICVDLNTGRLRRHTEGDSTHYNGFSVHASCWAVLTKRFQPNLVILFRACLSTPMKVRGTLAWSHGSLWPLESYATELEQRSRVNQSDPTHIQYIERAKRLKGGNIPHLLPIPACDIFSCLPVEILTQILSYLPSADVVRARIASRSFNQFALPGIFFKSRFEKDSDYGHIFEVREEAPDCWLSFYLWAHDISRQHPNTRNRQRIWNISSKLKLIHDQILNTPCEGTPIATDFEPTFDPDTCGFDWRTAAFDVSSRDDSIFASGCRAMRTRVVVFGANTRFRGMRVSFFNSFKEKYVSGLRFLVEGGQDIRIGYIRPNTEVSVDFKPPRCIEKFTLALDEGGINAIAVRDANKPDDFSQWAGNFTDRPAWHLSRQCPVDAIRAQFDAEKLVSLSIPQDKDPPDIRQICPWYPDPPKRNFTLDYDRSILPRNFKDPLTSVYFGQHSPLKKIVFWVTKAPFPDTLLAIEFCHENSWFDARFAGQNYQTHHSKDSFLSMSIDGHLGEKIARIEMARHYDGGNRGLKITTNTGRTLSFEPEGLEERNHTWVAVTASQPTVHGIVGICGYDIHSFGLISVNL